MTKQIDSTPIPVNQWTAAKSKHNGKAKGLSQAYDLRSLAYDNVMRFKDSMPDTDEGVTSSAREIASLIRAWAEADEHVRLWLNKPSPGSLRPVAKVKRSVKPSLAPVPMPQEPTPAPVLAPV
jgi:hypothetical protein